MSYDPHELLRKMREEDARQRGFDAQTQAQALVGPSISGAPTPSAPLAEQISALAEQVSGLAATLEGAREESRHAAARALLAAFIRHRTATHEVKPKVCVTCQESDAAIAQMEQALGAVLKGDTSGDGDEATDR